MKSNCCNAPLLTHAGIEGTNYYFCSRCMEACDPAPTLTLCQSCNCMTKTIEGDWNNACGKCGKRKRDRKENMNEPQLSAEMNKKWVKKIQQQRFNNIKSFLLESSATEEEEFINELADMMVMEIATALEEQRAEYVQKVEGWLVDLDPEEASDDEIWHGRQGYNLRNAELRAKLEAMKGSDAR